MKVEFAAPLITLSNVLFAVVVIFIVDDEVVDKDVLVIKVVVGKEDVLVIKVVVKTVVNGRNVVAVSGCAVVVKLEIVLLL